MAETAEVAPAQAPPEKPLAVNAKALNEALDAFIGSSKIRAAVNQKVRRSAACWPAMHSQQTSPAPACRRMDLLHNISHVERYRHPDRSGRGTCERKHVAIK